MANPIDPDSRPVIDPWTVRPNFMIAASGGGSGAGPSTVHRVAPEAGRPEMSWTADAADHRNDGPGGLA